MSDKSNQYICRFMHDCVARHNPSLCSHASGHSYASYYCDTKCFGDKAPQGMAAPYCVPLFEYEVQKQLDKDK